MISTPESPDDSNSTDLEKETDDDKTIEVSWENHNTDYEVISLGDGGFDRVTRPDYRSAKQAAKVHENVTGNSCEINKL